MFIGYIVAHPAFDFLVMLIETNSTNYKFQGLWFYSSVYHSVLKNSIQKVNPSNPILECKWTYI